MKDKRKDQVIVYKPSLEQWFCKQTVITFVMCLYQSKRLNFDVIVYFFVLVYRTSNVM